MANAELHAAAHELKLPLRFIHSTSELPPERHADDGLRLLLGERPLDIERLGQRRGRLSVVGLGPGAAEHMTPAVRRALDEAEDLLGYDTYVKMAGRCVPINACTPATTARSCSAPPTPSNWPPQADAW